MRKGEIEVARYIERYGLRELLSRELLEALRPIRRGCGEYLIRAGDEMEYLLFIVEGKAKVYSRMENGSSILVRFYRPFDILGDLELFSYDRYLMDVVAISDTLCLGVPADLIKRHADANAPLLMKLCERLGTKLAEFNVAAAINLRYSVECRLAGYLLAITEGTDSGDAQSDAGAGGATVSQATNDLGELADLLGTSYRQLARVVRRFRDAGILAEKRGRIAVTDRRKLEPLAGDYYL
ncbi:MAG: cyclic nucleotide-binding domain-containing protein [Treponemataceae bacterium]